MNLVQAIESTPNTSTLNGAPAFSTTYDACLDFFSQAASMRNSQEGVVNLFNRAYASNPNLAIRIALWLRDVRGGAGERESFRNILQELLIHNDFELVNKLASKIPEIGRWDDLLLLLDSSSEDAAISLIKQALRDNNSLCAKWLPREKNYKREIRKAIANGRQGVAEKYKLKAKSNNQFVQKLARKLGMTSKQYRKTLAGLSQVVESPMSRKDYEAIDYSKVPSLASARYQKAFERNDPKGYTKFKEQLVEGTTKVNAGAVYPYDVAKSAFNGDDIVSTAQWNALPDFVQEGKSFLPVIDVSGSMYTLVTESLSCLIVAISLGMYVAERNKSKLFKDHFITFSNHPSMVKIDTSLSLKERVVAISKSNWGYNTNIDATFQLILDAAINNKLEDKDMPDSLIIFSDMQFDEGIGSSSSGLTDKWAKKFNDAGYQLPNLVYWNLLGKSGRLPISKHQSGACIVSGFSPVLMKTVLSGKTPVHVMLETVMVERYSLS
jgi:hypothetical protein